MSDSEDIYHRVRKAKYEEQSEISGAVLHRVGLAFNFKKLLDCPEERSSAVPEEFVYCYQSMCHILSDFL